MNTWINKFGAGISSGEIDSLVAPSCTHAAARGADGSDNVTAEGEIWRRCWKKRKVLVTKNDALGNKDDDGDTWWNRDIIL